MYVILRVDSPGAQGHSPQTHHVCQRNDEQTIPILKDHSAKLIVYSFVYTYASSYLGLPTIKLVIIMQYVKHAEAHVFK